MRMLLATMLHTCAMLEYVQAMHVLHAYQLHMYIHMCMLLWCHICVMQIMYGCCDVTQVSFVVIRPHQIKRTY